MYLQGVISLNPSYHVEYRLKMQFSPAGAGSTDPPGGEYWCDDGSTVTITAASNAGYRFSHWTDVGSGVW